MQTVYTDLNLRFYPDEIYNNINMAFTHGELVHSLHDLQHNLFRMGLLTRPWVWPW